MHEHPAEDGSDGIMGGGVCAGVVYLDLPENTGKMVCQISAGSTASFTGLTLTPSSLCRTCGHHGFITDGRLVPA